MFFSISYFSCLLTCKRSITVRIALQKHLLSLFFLFESILLVGRQHKLYILQMLGPNYDLPPTALLCFLTRSSHLLCSTLQRTAITTKWRVYINASFMAVYIPTYLQTYGISCNYAFVRHVKRGNSYYSSKLSQIVWVR